MCVVIFGFGCGSNVDVILKVQFEGKFGKVKVVQVFVDKFDVGIFMLGVWYGVLVVFFDVVLFKIKFEGEGEVWYIVVIEVCVFDLVVLVGFMCVIKLGFLNVFVGKIINLYLSLLLSFFGFDGIGQVFWCGVKIMGCMVYYVIVEVDGGLILDQVVV